MAEKARFIHDDIVTDFLYVLDISLDEIVRSSTNITLKFDNFSTVEESTSYDTYLQTYESFIEGTFSNLTNTVITLEKFTPDFYFYPYNSSFKIQQGKLYLYVRDYARLNYIDIVVKTNHTNASVSSEPVNDSAGNPELRLNVTDSTAADIKFETYRLDPVGENQKIIIEYDVDDPKPNITIEFGKHTDISLVGPDIITYGTLYIEVYDLEAKIDRFHINYDLTGKNTILQTNATIYIE